MVKATNVLLSTMSKLIKGLKKNTLVKLILVVSLFIVYASLLTSLIEMSATSMSVNASEYVVRSYSRTTELPDIKVETEVKEMEINNVYPKKYAYFDTEVLESLDPLAPVIANVNKRDVLYIIESDDEYSKVVTKDGVVGYINSGFVSEALALIFDETSELYYSDGELKILEEPFENAREIQTLDENVEIEIVGKNDLQYWKAEYEDLVVYVDKDHLLSEPIPTPTPTPAPTPAPSVASAPPTNYNGAVLTRFAGTIMGPSGKETYYNLNMSGVIAIMQGAGYNYEYWVRDDGVKMYGDYVMAACGFTVRPRGTLVETSLGTAICADTGTFSYDNPYQIDIAVSW